MELLAFYGEDTVDVSTVYRRVIKMRESGKNLDLNDHLWPGRPVITTLYLNRQKFDELIQDNQ
jgi:hypothetical protein